MKKYKHELKELFNCPEIKEKTKKYMNKFLDIRSEELFNHVNKLNDQINLNLKKIKEEFYENSQRESNISDHNYIE
jgi:hypothetical protein